VKYKAFQAAELLKIANTDLDTNAETQLLKGNDNVGDTENQIVIVRVLPMYIIIMFS